MTLIQRIEGAAEGSRELDALICELVELPTCHEPDCLPDVLRKAIAQTLDGSWPHDTDSVPAYTSSLDAAMSLTDPKDWFRNVMDADDANGALAHFESIHDGTDIRTRGATWPLAIVLASLKARGVME